MQIFELNHREEFTEELVDLITKEKNDEMMNKETLQSFSNDYLLKRGEHGFVSQVLKSTFLSKIPENMLKDVLEGKSFIRKETITKYFVVAGDGVNRLDKFNCDYLKDEGEFYQIGDALFNKQEYDDYLKWKSENNKEE